MSELLAALPEKRVIGEPPRSVSSIAGDSRLVEPGACFVAVPGFKQDGRRFILDAIRRGAAVVVTEGEPVADLPVAQVLVPSVRVSLARLAGAFYGHPSTQLTLVGITGTNGKTTTSYLVEALLRARGLGTGVIGTIQYVLGDETRPASQTTPEALDLQSMLAHMRDRGVRGVAMEVSSHALALARADGLAFDVAVFTNLTQDHLDFHGTLESYRLAKRRLFELLAESPKPARTAVINADDAIAPQYAPGGPRVFWFSRLKRVASGCYLRGEEIVFRSDGVESVLLERKIIGLRGSHNIENVLAAGTAVRLAGVEPAEIAEGVRTFAGVEHRIEYVATISGVEYFNDSKATNVDATLKALDAFPGNVLVILGGKDKGSDYRILRQALRSHARMALLIGSAADKIEADLAGVIPVERAGTMARAVEVASRSAKPGDIVLLAPACASFDQFDSYEHRGRVFKQLVRELEKEHAA